MRLLLLSTADTELLAAHSAGGYVTANPSRIDLADLDGLCDGVDVVVVRLLGGLKAWREGVDDLRRRGLPLVALGGEAAPDAELMALSTVPAGVAAEALAYLREGGVANLRELARFLSDTVLLTGEGFEPPQTMPAYGVHRLPERTAEPAAGPVAAAGVSAPRGESSRTPAASSEASPSSVVSGEPVPSSVVSGESSRSPAGPGDGRPTVAVVFYRAHELSGNTAFVDTLCARVAALGAEPLPVFCGSLRSADDGLLDLLRRADTVILTVLAAGGAAGGTAADASAGGDADGWDAGALAALDVPLVQGLCLTTSRATWEASDAALSPMDAAMQVAIPEFDGRLISVPFSFKEEGPDGIPVYAADPERAARVAGIAVRLARLRHTPVAERRLAIVLSSYPTKHARVGNAVGLDTPVSAVRLLTALRAAGYTVGEHPDDGDELIHSLIAAGGHDVEWLTEEQLRAASARVPAKTYEEWFAALPEPLRSAVREHWGEPPGELYVDETGGAPEPTGRASAADRRAPSARTSAADRTGPVGRAGTAGAESAARGANTAGGPGRGGRRAAGTGPDIVLATLRFGNVLLMIQPPRGFGENPVAIYHDPDLPPSHHYLAAYRWLDEVFGADAVVHLGKHGTLEWLPGKGLGLSAECAPDAVLGDLPLVYPFIVNDPGEGTQAKRRGHAVIVDHMVPPMARADTYGDLAKLEQLLDEYATVQALDPAKLPTVRAQIWTLVQAAQLHHDLHVSDQPGEADFDDFVLHVDGYLCEVKDVQIRDGLHILGQAPEGGPRVDMVLAVLRAAQVWGGRAGALPGLRAAIARLYGLDERALLADPGAPVDTGKTTDATGTGAAAAGAAVPGVAGLAEIADGPARTGADVVDLLEAVARRLVVGMETLGWDVSRAADVCAEVLGQEAPGVVTLLEFAAREVVPRLAATSGEIDAVLHALNGGYVPAGPSGSPTRGLVNVLPTGRNFYSVDPKAIPSRNAWDVGVALADSLIRRHRDDTGEYPRSVGLTVWGTSAMRTQGDDIAEVLALIGARPTWDDASRRVTGFTVIPRAELGRPRVDVTLRISGFFRDAFPHVIALVDDAIQAVAALDEPENHVRAHALADAERHGDWRRATSRIFGSKPGAYGAGLLPLIDARNWRDDRDLAEVYAVWGGYAYGRGLDGREARADMEAAFRRITVAAKNQDTREHDIVDSDDYFQYHGGMVAMVRALTGASPAAYVGDSALPEQVKTRTLGEETRRVFRARVVNPRWIAAMRRHGYKGAFELAATVDYLFGYDATAGVVDDWMYEKLAQEYVFDEENRAFMERSNPWALRGIAERLLEAADRRLWAEPSAETLDRLRRTYLDLEGDLEAGEA